MTMTDREKAIVMAHTGICMLTGEKFSIFHKYVDEIMGRPVLTHEIGMLANEIKAKSKSDFIELCEDANTMNEDDIQKLQDIEQAEIQKAFDVGRMAVLRDIKDYIECIRHDGNGKKKRFKLLVGFIDRIEEGEHE